MTITVTPLADISSLQDAANTVINVSANFDDPLTTGLVARFELYDTSLAGGVMNVVLFDQPGRGAPQTVQNFQNYVNDGDYVNSIIHRSVPGFVVQGGGFTSTDVNSIPPIPTDAPVTNEFSLERSNTRGTIAMAKLGGNPNSATSQWFFNLADNNDPNDPNSLDNQNGGFTVFGEVLSESDLDVAEAIAGLPRPFLNNQNTSPVFREIPLIVEDQADFDDLGVDDLVRYRSITISQREELTFSIVGNSNPTIVSASIVNNTLLIDYLPGESGTAAITVRATNLLGETQDDTFLINVTPTSITGGADQLQGTVRDDVINGRGGNDRITGNSGDDRLIGGGGNDRLVGQDGNDTLLGRGGNDRLIGNAGNDTLIGGNGNDVLKAGSGRDELNGGKGDNTLIGGDNRDIFVLSKGQGEDSIRRFRNGQDRLRVRGISFNDLTITDQGRNTLISDGQDVLATLKGVRADTINRRDFA
ncbi:MAG: peptidylprolyl isomerase [Leptolyngbyaceae bacterium]|nr:peptidylprolyl isomerase [Leptolyngbyaceae bacterium]